MSNPYPHLFSELDVGPFALRNRIIATGHNPQFQGADGLLGDEEIAFHVRKAEGGIALSTTGGTSVHPSGGAQGGLLCFDDAVLPGYLKLARGMHANGARMLVQLGHGSSAAPSRHNGYPKWAPSPTRGEFSDEQPHVMSIAEIEEVIHAYYEASRRVRRGGLDGIEVQAIAGGLISQFLSAHTNRRTDEYGGSFAGRVRFFDRILGACREALGDDRVVAVKIPVDELYAEGMRIADVQRIVRHVDRSHLINYYVAGSGNNLERFARVDHWPPTPAPHGLHVELAAALREVTERPVAALGRIVTPAHAERLIASGKCDFVAMVRAIMADPDLPKKAAEDRTQEIRPCVGASVCVDRIIDGGASRCIYNPLVGRQVEWGDPVPAATSRRVVVIGGGPGGLEAARVAALRGHMVTLYERAEVLGGTARVVGRQPGREELQGIPDWLEGEVRRLKVDVHLGVGADAERVAADGPDVVVLATGADPVALSPFPEATIPVVTAWSVLDGRVTPGRRVLVLDNTGKQEGCAVAELVADGGGVAQVVTRHFHPAVYFGLTNTITLYRRVLGKAVTFVPHHDLRGVDGTAARLENIYSRETRLVDDLDMIVIVQMRVANDVLATPLREQGLDVRVIGDALAPRDIEDAVADGHRAARSI